MSALEMQVTGGLLLVGGVVFFIVSQLLLNTWYKSYNAEMQRMQ